MRTPIPPGDRPNLRSARRRDWRLWFFQEWGLLLLAAVLAILIWNVTSKRVITDRKLEGVRVELAVADHLQGRVGAVLLDPTTTMQVDLSCSERQKREALEALDRDGGPAVTLRVVAPVTSTRELARDDDVSRYAWPFPEHQRIIQRVPYPAGWVLALRDAHPRVGWPDRQRATLPVGDELDKRGIGVSIEVAPATVHLKAPQDKRAADYELLVPDPIDLYGLVGRAGSPAAAEDIPFGKPQRVVLTFEGWRSGAVERWENAWRESLELPQVTATVTLIQQGRWEAAQNRLVVMLPQEYVTHVDRQMIPGMIPAGKLEFRGTLEGPQAVLDAMRADLDGWGWGLQITSPASELPKEGADGGPGEPTTLSARLFWFPVKEDYRGRGVTFRPEPGQEEFDVDVRYWKRKP